jgi:hypothetical protein
MDADKAFEGWPHTVEAEIPVKGGGYRTVFGNTLNQ